MADKIIKIKKLPSGCAAIAVEASQGTLAIEIGAGVFLTADDIPDIIRLLRAADKHFLGKE